VTGVVSQLAVEIPRFVRFNPNLPPFGSLGTKSISPHVSNIMNISREDK
jgi:hypothetical protein